MASHPNGPLPPEKLMSKARRAAINRRNGRKGAAKTRGFSPLGKKLAPYVKESSNAN